MGTTITRLAAVLAAGTVSLAAVTAGATAAAAAPGGTSAPVTTAERAAGLAAEKARCLAAVDVRLPELRRLDAALAAARRVTDAHRQAQAASLTTATSGLQALRTTIAADTDRTALDAHCRSIVDDYRVFALRAPQTHLVVAGDAAAAGVAALADATTKLATALDRAAAAGRDVTAARGALADLRAKTADASGRLAGLVDGVVAVTPSQYDADHGVLDGARAGLKAVAADLHAARADVAAIAAALKG